MTLKNLEIFYDLAKTNSTTVTAKNLNITQSAVSIAISKLENYLQIKLFDRIGKRLILNSNGKLFYEKSKKYYDGLIDSVNFFKSDNLSGELNIAFSKTIGNYYMPLKLVKFIEKYKDIKIIKSIENSTNIINKILEAKIDLGFIETEVFNKEIEKLKIAEDELIFVSSTIKGEYFIDTLFNKKWILREEGSGTREIFLNAIKNIGEINIFYESSEFEDIKKVLLNTKDTITCISRYVVEEELRNNKLFEVKIKNINLKRNFYVIYHKNKFFTKIIKEFLNFVIRK